MCQVNRTPVVSSNFVNDIKDTLTVNYIPVSQTAESTAAKLGGSSLVFESCGIVIWSANGWHSDDFYKDFIK